MRKLSVALATLMISSAVTAAEMRIEVRIPTLKVAEYHRPYVAIWLERPDQSVAAQLAVWYDGALPKQEGNKWLKDLRQWWRRGGRELAMPLDGLSGATRAPGEHLLTLSGKDRKLSGLSAGSYVLVVEAAREVGGREVLQLPFQWPPKQRGQWQQNGMHELAGVRLELTP